MEFRSLGSRAGVYLRLIGSLLNRNFMIHIHVYRCRGVSVDYVIEELCSSLLRTIVPICHLN